MVGITGCEKDIPPFTKPHYYAVFSISAHLQLSAIAAIFGKIVPFLVPDMHANMPPKQGPIERLATAEEKRTRRRKGKPVGASLEAVWPYT